MRLTVLGSSTPYPRPGNPCSGYLVQSATATMWMDAGTGTLAELQRHIRLDSLDAIWISHTHADHSADLLTAYYAFRFGEFSLEQPIPLFGPPGLIERMVAFLGPQSEKVIPEVFEFREMKRSGRAMIGDLSLRWHRVQHGMPAFGLRIEAEDVALAYSGDSRRCDELIALADGATTLLCEVGDSEHRDPKNVVHCTPEEAGEIAATAAIDRLLVTHIGSEMSAEQAAYRAQATFAGAIDIARPGHVFDIEPYSSLF